MVQPAMGGRWTSFLFFILILKTHGCWSLNSEGLALLKFREKLEVESSGALANWNPDHFDACMWSGIECVDGRVVIVNLTGYDLEGVLAPELGGLSHIRYLDLSKNNLSGTIPPELGQLTTLEVLDLRDNNLSGKVPAELGGLQSLKQLLLCNNKFEGSIPLEIEKLSFLTDLRHDDAVTSSAAAEIGCVNRKFGHCILQSVLLKPKKSDSFPIPIKWDLAHYLGLLPQFKLGHELPDNHDDDSCCNLTGDQQDFPEPEPEPDLINDMQKEVTSLRRILAEQSSNLIAIPPSVGAPAPSETDSSLPSRSSGSFPAVPNAPIPSPVSAPSTPSDQNNGPQGTAYASSTHPTDKGSSNTAKSRSSLNLIIGISGAILVLIVSAVALYIFRSRASRTLVPWKTGLSGQLRKAFVTGVPKLHRCALETACEDFSNIIRVHDGVATLYKGTLSSGVEITVVSSAITSLKEWSTRAELAFRKKIDTLSRVNHKNFVNLIGYCEENVPFTRMMVFEYAPNGTLFEHLHVEELEHLDWHARMRIIMGTAYCLQHMHDLNPPIPHPNLDSKEIFLTDDYAAKIADVGFWADLIAKTKNRDESEHSELPPLADVDTNVHSFGIMLLEVISGRLPHSEEHGDLVNWAAQFLSDKRTINQLIDPTLKSFKEDELRVVCEVIQSCLHEDARKRPSMKEISEKLMERLNISPDVAMPRLSPLWWAELEILSAEAA